MGYTSILGLQRTLNIKLYDDGNREGSYALEPERHLVAAMLLQNFKDIQGRGVVAGGLESKPKKVREVQDKAAAWVDSETCAEWCDYVGIDYHAYADYAHQLIEQHLLGE